jgi:hypothetical protein
MATKYTKIDASVEAKVHDGYLYVRTTGMNFQGVLVQGDRVGTIYRMPFTGTLEDAKKEPWCIDMGMNAIDTCTMGGKGEMIKKGRLIR